ncbi:TonB-linked SusC/RagA family outer membrane protein [Dinghuibacter silviterrae]|uniref:TonB-linked SusC/RagA family outer membrane protein n=2 Tax=Dinghuibacter silviterrae TaxID=1539049 RepID=A0A4V3GLL4_9BACT|nr:TonB-linked SusC/RagA family outer membrane protein [Dinghuibacter silviterrae]
MGRWCPHAVKKAFFIMKLTVLLVLATTLQVSAKVNGQAKISLHLDKVEISRALNSIERQGVYHFLYNSRLSGIEQKVSIDAKEEDVRDVLTQMFTGTDLTYKMLENNLIVVLSAKPAPQDIKVTGRVTGASGESVVGASVTVKGTSNGTTTDYNGGFTLTVPDGGVLVISSIGFKTQEVPVSGQSVINIKMDPSSKVMDEVVVVGYGVQRKIDVTGAVSTVKGDEIARQASVNPISALQGKVAGVQITNSGSPGAAPQILIRGLGTYYGSTGPLYVVDGVWVSDVSFLNPADIETLSVLKDASSEAIYGINGANGVIVITTKKGSRSGKTTVTYNGSVGYQKVTNQVKMADAYQYAVMFNELGRATNSNPVLLDSSQFGTGTNWFDQILRNALVTNHQVDVSGGTDKSSYNFSLGYLYQDGVLKDNDYQRYTARMQNDFQITKNIKLGYTAVGMYATSDDPPGGIWHEIYSAPPVVPVYFKEGNYGDPGYYGLGQAVSNPQVSLDFNHAQSRDYNLTGGAYLDIKFLKHFTWHTNIGGEYIMNASRNYVPVYKATSTQANSVSSLSIINYDTRKWIAENTLTYSNIFGDHSITALVGQHADYYFYDEVHMSATGVPNQSSGNWYLGLGNGGSGTVSDVDPNTYNPAYPLESTVSSYFGRVQYSYKDRYSLNATMRGDGSSKFIGSNRWGYFPSVGAAWIVTGENFMQNQHVFNTLKVKGSWGKVGNVAIPTFVSTLTSVSGGGYSVIYGNTGVISNGVSVASITPPPLAWEKGVGTDIGLEAVTLANRLSIEADYYNKTTQGFVFQVNIPGSVGAATSYIITNVGNIRNRGFELSLNWKDNISKDFSYSIGGNVTINNNQVVSNSAGSQKIYNGGEGATGGLFTTVTTLGQPIGEYYGYKVVGVFQSAADVAAYKDSKGNLYQPSAQPGDFKYASTTGVGPISGNDRQYLGNPNPKYTYGINTNWAYKHFDLSVDVQGVADVSVYNANKGLRYGAENWTQDFYNKRWHGAGTSNSYPSVNIGGGTNYNPNSWFVESGSYFRIRNLQLGYTVPSNVLNRPWIQKIRVYADAQNPFNFFKYTGFSPEIGGTPGNAGIDNSIYPLYATYRLGVTLTF